MLPGMSGDQALELLSQAQLLRRELLWQLRLLFPFGGPDLELDLLAGFHAGELFRVAAGEDNFLDWARLERPQCDALNFGLLLFEGVTIDRENFQFHLIMPFNFFQPPM